MRAKSELVLFSFSRSNYLVMLCTVLFSSNHVILEEKANSKEEDNAIKSPTSDLFYMEQLTFFFFFSRKTPLVCNGKHQQESSGRAIALVKEIQLCEVLSRPPIETLRAFPGLSCSLAAAAQFIGSGKVIESPKSRVKRPCWMRTPNIHLKGSGMFVYKALAPCKFGNLVINNIYFPSEFSSKTVRRMVSRRLPRDIQ